MPTPLEILLDPISLVMIAMYLFVIIWEALAPGRTLPKVNGWRIRGLLAFAVYFYLASYLPLIWDGYLASLQLFDLTYLGVIGGAFIGVLLYELFVYVWHRTMHKTDWLWKSFHQMHHSAERMDTYGAFYFSPLDMAGWTFGGSLCLSLIVGLSPQAVTATLLITHFLAIFQHTNIRTPQWIGYFIQRPESHTVHHAKGVHAFNYSDLPLFDIIFATFRNPATYENETGFYDGASSRIGEMLIFKDVSLPAKENDNKEDPYKPTMNRVC